MIRAERATRMTKRFPVNYRYGALNAPLIFRFRDYARKFINRGGEEESRFKRKKRTILPRFFHDSSTILPRFFDDRNKVFVSTAFRDRGDAIFFTFTNMTREIYRSGFIDRFSYGATYNPRNEPAGIWSRKKRGERHARGPLGSQAGRAKARREQTRGYDNRRPTVSERGEGGTSDDDDDDDEDSRARHDYALDIPFFFDADCLTRLASDGSVSQQK